MPSTNRDAITDFSHVDDSFHLDNAVFTRLPLSSTLNANFFRAGPAALDANDYIVYNRPTARSTTMPTATVPARRSCSRCS